MPLSLSGVFLGYLQLDSCRQTQNMFEGLNMSMGIPHNPLGGAEGHSQRDGGLGYLPYMTC